jgi:hypothetical protein
VESIKNVWNVENKKRIVKMSFAFGTISETKTDDQHGGFDCSYDASPPSVEKSVKHGPPMVVNNPEALNTFCNFVLTQLQVVYDKNGLNSSTRIVAVYSV